MTTNLSSKIKKNLREFLLNQTGYDNIKDAYTIYGVNNANDFYNKLNKDYEKEQKNILKEQAKVNAKKFVAKALKDVQKKSEEKKVRKQENKLKMPIDKLEDFVNKWYGNKKGHFEITLKSLIANVRRTFKFNHISQFNNWIKKLTEEKEIDSKGNTINKDEYDVFSRFKVENIKLISGGCNKHESKSIELKSSFYKYKLFNPTSKSNNCFFACLNHIRSLGEDRYIYNKLRKQFKLENETEITIAEAYNIISCLGYANLQIIDYDTNEELEDDIQYIVIQGSHYYVLESFEQIVLKDKKTKRGLLTFDFETRPTEEFDTIKATGEKLYILQDTLCCVYYRKYKSEECNNVKFITNNDKSSARQLIDWFNDESKNGRTYNVIAHNGGRFDYYFFISALTSLELLECDIHFRGTTIISINYRGHLFKDSACFLTDSLKNLSKSFKVSDGKITEFNLHGTTITSEQLCFYKHYLTFNQFLDLQNTDKEFWNLYEKYCLYDCIALFQIWEKFTICVNSLIEKINPYLLRKCPLMSSTTIGSHSKKIIVEVNKIGKNINQYKKDLESFTGVYYEEERNDKPMSDAQEWCVKKGKLPRTLFYRNTKKIDTEKYDFLCNFKRGGISHCNKEGKHMSGITGVDIASQYPASLIYSMIPTGNSYWVNNYDETKYGFYCIENLVFNSYLLKPVALGIKNESLNWGINDMKELYVDSYMLKYIIDNYGLISFDVVKGLVSNTEIESSKIFGKYIGTFYDEKKQQDKYKTEKNELYNEALRSTIKLYLNSLTGKLVENPAIHFSVKFNTEGTKSLNGQGITKTTNEDKFNDWIVAGIMVYSYSKRLLFEYIKCLPDNSNDVIHIETDGIYFSTRHLEAFSKNLENYKGDYPCKFGEDLGNLKIEKTTYEGQVAYFLGKKFYCITKDDKFKTLTREEIIKIEGEKDEMNIYRIKGFPQKTINPDGSNKYLVDVSLYEECYKGKEITRSFQTLKKSLFCDKTRITAYTMTRTIKGKNNYKLYE
jgi:hypothetical protein